MTCFGIWFQQIPKRTSPLRTHLFTTNSNLIQKSFDHYLQDTNTTPPRSFRFRFLLFRAHSQSNFPSPASIKRGNHLRNPQTPENLTSLTHSNARIFDDESILSFRSMITTILLLDYYDYRCQKRDSTRPGFAHINKDGMFRDLDGKYGDWDATFSGSRINWESWSRRRYRAPSRNGVMYLHSSQRSAILNSATNFCCSHSAGNRQFCCRRVLPGVDRIEIMMECSLFLDSFRATRSLRQW